MLSFLKKLLGMTFGGDDAIDMVRNDPELTPRETTVGVNFLERTGVDVTIVSDLEAKQTGLQDAIQTAEQGAASATARLEKIPNETTAAIKDINDETADEKERLENTAVAQKKLVDDNAEYRTGKLQKKINRINGHASTRNENILGRSKDAKEAFKQKQKGKIDRATAQFNQELASTPANAWQSTISP
ncbi:hypothetical protein MYX07_00995 [Patescibacteria group bacterium AH-259-L07]|nr:hypothetical protein [Patescibacteria group bacterium AH-259-L07]